MSHLAPPASMQARLEPGSRAACSMLVKFVLSRQCSMHPRIRQSKRMAAGSQRLVVVIVQLPNVVLFVDAWGPVLCERPQGAPALTCPLAGPGSSQPCTLCPYSSQRVIPHGFREGRGFVAYLIHLEPLIRSECMWHFLGRRRKITNQRTSPVEAMGAMECGPGASAVVVPAHELPDKAINRLGSRHLPPPAARYLPTVSIIP